MNVRDAHRSNVIVQTQGNIVVNVEREPVRLSKFRLQLASLRPFVLVSALVGLAGLGFAEQARLIEGRELRSSGRLDLLQTQIEALSAASSRQASDIDRVVEKVGHVEDDVAALPAMVKATVQASTSTLVGAMSNLELRPSFQNLYAAASGFQSDVENASAKLQPASAARVNSDFEPRRNRQPLFRRRFGRYGGLTPANAVSGGSLEQDTEPLVPTSEP